MLSLAGTTFLVAGTCCVTSFRRRTVILLLRNSEEGSFGAPCSTAGGPAYNLRFRSSSAVVQMDGLLLIPANRIGSSQRRQLSRYALLSTSAPRAIREGGPEYRRLRLSVFSSLRVFAWLRDGRLGCIKQLGRTGRKAVLIVLPANGYIISAQHKILSSYFHFSASHLLRTDPILNLLRVYYHLKALMGTDKGGSGRFELNSKYAARRRN